MEGAHLARWRRDFGFRHAIACGYIFSLLCSLCSAPRSDESVITGGNDDYFVLARRGSLCFS